MGQFVFWFVPAHVLLFSFQRGPRAKCEPSLRCQDPRDRRKNVRNTTEGLFADIYEVLLLLLILGELDTADADIYIEIVVKGDNPDANGFIYLYYNYNFDIPFVFNLLLLLDRTVFLWKADL
ncbi:hypothetical protein TNIN_337241 [Trichonephila inaurata madagascariensis]|uniref:Uncharacterized protein n=1 Tax=Trichonephila inaurata madagascariensis TaxID=2747483 RepID=A0A8X6XMN1_9ARAC|nr:hypothetical protein TNIN_337241 [Trichonephila inaurata madagascariensis]